MKLYATVTSERASKGQGGEWLDITVKNEAQEPIFFIQITPLRFTLDKYDDGLMHTVYDTKWTKGEKQKDECDGKHESVQAILDCAVCKNDPLLQ